MNPFPGESIGLSYVYGVGEEIIKRAGSATFSAGDEWRGWSIGYGDYQDSPDIDASFSWVLEVLSGSVTFTVSEALDPSFAEDPALPPTRTLGSFTATGPGTFAIPSGFSLADGWTGQAFMVVLEATSGSAVIQQLKLRLWPPGGPVGGWSSTQPAWEQTVTGEVRAASFSGFYYLEGFPQPTGEDAYNSLASLHGGGPPYYLGDPEDITALSPPSITGFGNAQMEARAEGQVASVSSYHDYVLITGRDPAGSSPIEPGLSGDLDYVRPPNEVSGDVDYYAQIDGSAAFSWNPISRELSIRQEGAGADVGSSAGVFLVATPGEWDGASLEDIPPAFGYEDSPGLYRRTLYAAGDSEDVSTMVALPTSGRDILITLTWTGIPVLPNFSMFTGGFLSPATAAWRWSFDFTPPTGAISHPPYRVWLPTAQRPSPHLIFARSDDLGAGAALVYKRDTRQSSGLVYGNY